MATTVSEVQNRQGVELFYYLKITGIPYYFFAVKNPGWTLPTGYTAVMGMDRPDDRMEQEIRDIVGGIASPERLRVKLTDFTTTGSTRFLARLFAPGRLSFAGPVPELESRIRVADDNGATFNVRNCTDDFFDGATHVHVGAECIELDEEPTPADGRATLTIGARNQFPCASDFPPVPYHRVYLTDGDTLGTGEAVTGTGVPGRNQLVTTEPVTLIGRTCAFYIGHITSDGTACAEADTWRRLLGRIVSMNVSREGGHFELQLESIMGDLEDSAVAPGLATAAIRPGFINLAPAEWRQFAMDHRVIDDDDNVLTERTYHFQIDNGGTNIYSSADELLDAFNDMFRDGIFLAETEITFSPRLWIANQEGERRFAISGSIAKDEVNGHQHDFRFRNILTTTTEERNREVEVGLMTVLGFKQSATHEAHIDRQSTSAEFSPGIVADIGVPSCFVPYGYRDGTSVRLAPPDYSASEFLDDQGTGTAYVRFGDGTIVKLTDVEAGTHLNQLTVSVTPGKTIAKYPSGRNVVLATGTSCYRVPEGQQGTVAQVVLIPADVPGDQGVTAGQIVGRILASNPAGSVDATYNVYDEGIGFGWIDILDTESLGKLAQADVQREIVIDSTTRMSEIFTPLAKEYGWLLVWDPEQSKVAIRKIMVPAAPVAHTFELTESTRTSPSDRTEQRVDVNSMRTSWTLKWGWDRAEKKFIAPDLTFSDRWTLSAFGGLGRKTETIEDKTLVYRSNNSGLTVIGGLLERSYFYRQPWLRCRRTMTKAALALAPGSVHKIIDSTLINPFTGEMGVEDADRVYGLLMGVSANPANDECEIDFTINRADPAGLFRWWSPCGLVDFAAGSNGYNSGTGVLTMDSFFASDGTSDDGIDFEAGDKVILVSWDNPDAPAYYQETTASAVAANGSTITVAAGLPALSTTRETLVILQEYADQTASRLADVAFQGAESGVIDETDDQNHRWL